MAARIKHLFHEPDGGATIGTRVPDVFQHFGRAARTAAGGISPAAVPAILTALFAGPPRREVFASPRQLAPARTCRVGGAGAAYGDASTSLPMVGVRVDKPPFRRAGRD